MTSDAGPIRILSVDDHPMLRQGIAGLVAVQPDMTLVAEAANGREAIHQFRAHLRASSSAIGQRQANRARYSSSKWIT
jgi:DNA-binding NarL/FixJ family response regulator